MGGGAADDAEAKPEARAVPASAPTGGGAMSAQLKKRGKKKGPSQEEQDEQGELAKLGRTSDHALTSQLVLDLDKSAGNYAVDIGIRTLFSAIVLTFAVVCTINNSGWKKNHRRGRERLLGTSVTSILVNTFRFSQTATFCWTSS